VQRAFDLLLFTLSRFAYHSAMRTIGSLDSEAAAHRFADILYVEGIENQVDPEDDGTFSIWVMEEEKIARGAELLQRFRSDSSAAEFRDSPARARQLRARDARLADARRSTVADTARIGYEREFRGFAYLPLALIVASIAVAIYSRFGNDHRALQPFFISNYIRDPQRGIWQPGSFLAEVRAGQVWRLVTPIFIHFGPIHLLFNVLMLRDLGTFVENRLGIVYFAVLATVIAVLSNIAQFAWTGRPDFGGLSGLVYGLFGFLWMRGKFDRGGNWPLSKATIQILLIWYVLCLTNLISSVANTAHTVGLGVGMLWGYLSARK
jgi:GlpG protein